MKSSTCPLLNFHNSAALEQALSPPPPRSGRLHGVSVRGGSRKVPHRAQGLNKKKQEGDFNVFFFKNVIRGAHQMRGVSGIRLPPTT